MRVLRALVRRLTGGDVRALRAEVAELRNTVTAMNDVLMALNHEVHSGSERALPLWVGRAERLRLDADAAVGAAQAIERLVVRLEQRIEQLEKRS